MATIELDPLFVRAIRLMNSTTVRDADEQIRIMLEEAVKAKYGAAKTIGVIEKESTAGKREPARKEEVVLVESGTESGRASPEVVDLDDDEFALGILEDDLTCVVCHGMGVTARNQLVECIECHALYHQECHSPPVTDLNDVRSVWYCAACSRTVGKPPARASPKIPDRADGSPFKRTESKPLSGRSTPNAAPSSVPKSPAGAGGSKLASGASSSKAALPKVNIVSADKRLQDMKKKAAAKLHEKRHRGTVYASYALDHPDKLQVVAVAEPRAIPRSRIRNWFNLADDRCFTSWKDLALVGKIADCVIVATQDSMHAEPAVQFAGMGYHVLLEKPMAVSVTDCVRIYRACEAAGVMLVVCHVLRYFPPVLTIRALIEAGAVGRVAHIQHTENVGYWHFAHSFVRGNWRNQAESTFSLLAKCCHDLDMVHYWMGHQKCTRISSIGSLYHFRRENQPAGAADRCVDCSVEAACPYSACKVYLQPLKGQEGPARYAWPQYVVQDPPEGASSEQYHDMLLSALHMGPYGRCVYACDNDVCDNQTVSLQFKDGATATVTMVAFTSELCLRSTKVFGSRGTLSWSGKAEGPILHHDFSSGTVRTVVPNQPDLPSARLAGHGGADHCLMDAFVKAVALGDSSYIKSGSLDSLRSHLLVFAAEESRLTGSTSLLDYETVINS